MYQIWFNTDKEIPILVLAALLVIAILMVAGLYDVNTDKFIWKM